MTGDTLYIDLMKKFKNLLEEHQLLNSDIIITGQALSVAEAIGQPDRQDFPLVKGKERLMQANFRGALGQAFTDMPGSFQGSLQEVAERIPRNNYQRAVLIASMNAVLKYLGLIENTIHCKNNEPDACADKLADYIKSKYGDAALALIGLQPAMCEKLARNFKVRLVDLDADNIGQMKCGVLVEDPAKTREIIAWCDVVVSTGSTVVNGTMPDFFMDKPVIFFGTSCAAAAYFMNLERFCSMAG
ncbi:MAG: Rossmann-like domain-containing protein [Syntrophomonadaceae bacterium]|jgi:hypothetical protein